MKLMKPTMLFLAVISSLAALSTCTAGTFKGPWGLQLYSLRTELATNVPGTLDEVKSWGVKNVELAGTYNLTPEQFKAQLDSAWPDRRQRTFSVRRIPHESRRRHARCEDPGIEVCRLRVDSAR